MLDIAICPKHIASVGLALLLSAAVGCGDDEDALAPELVGTYQTTSHVEYRDGCSTDGEASAPDEMDTFPYFRLSVEEMLGARFLSFNECSAPDECEEGLSFGNSWDLFEKKDGHWTGESSYSSNAPGSTECSVGLTRTQAFDEDDTIRFERRSYSGRVTVETEDDCEPELAAERLSELQCESLEVLQGELESS